jgi:hypothetical protein
MFITSAPSRLPASSNGLRAGGVLEEQVDLRHPGQHVGLLHRAAVQVDIAVGKVEDGGDLQRAELFDPQKMAGAEGHGRVPLSGFPLYRKAGRGGQAERLRGARR